MQFLSKYSVMELFRENAFNIKFYRYHDTFMILYTRLILLAHTISFISYKHVLIAISLYACTMLIQTEENYNNNYKHSLRYSLVIVDRISIFRKFVFPRVRKFDIFKISRVARFRNENVSVFSRQLDE